VTGKAVHKNEPLIAGSIWFHPDASNEVIGEPSSCVLQMDGSFKMRTYPYGDGVPPGKYKITFHQNWLEELSCQSVVVPPKLLWSWWYRMKD